MALSASLIANELRAFGDTSWIPFLRKVLVRKNGPTYSHNKYGQYKQGTDTEHQR
jgi:hypothetical protein